MWTLRAAVVTDLNGIFAIYDREVLRGTATFDTESHTAQQRQDWFARHQPPRHPILVAEEAGTIIAWGSLSAYSDRCAYARAAEVSAYVHHDHRRAGLGRALLQALIEAARAAKLGVLLSRITSESQASLALHAALGFRRVGTLHRVGEKLGRVLDVELLELVLDAP
jgi:phosphinothricin acetyltransferase